MKLFRVVFSFCLVMVLSGLFMASPAQAQDLPCIDHPACEAEPSQDGLCRIYLDAPRGGAVFLNEDTINGQINGVPRSTPGCYDASATYALAGWRFNQRGGAKVQHVMFKQAEDGLHFALSDKDGGEFADGFVWLYRLPEGTRLRSDRRNECRTSCDLGSNQVGNRYFTVIAGFDFRRLDGDGHVKRFGLTSTTLLDFRGFRATFADDDFPFEVEVQYALVRTNEPFVREAKGDLYYSNHGDYDEIRARSPDAVHRKLITFANSAVVALTSFSFSFWDGGHFIEFIGVEPRKYSIGHGVEVWFQDNQSDEDLRFPDDPFFWRVEYARLP